ncbi:hypothetical protein PTSG_07800 [Salpingoeca rosetta]|uniref:Fibronectin type-II domain-containing protein n=1 Tax=Salpingoeca rosetta (strain ATCC 50818 / BSB-021) TaxID=946362 RepID=F2UGD0_SALR5|nr:uncharacterized protein PTSG_07800 [Salpingoeca rosetta]EGD75680.1 hypothetical protein PTSG_07800 [Salpingoeca rosetta]|eukprot:XP_004991601.1 hypothetical protein PTSG_07800 [Salpingoeca rosetta]
MRCCSLVVAAAAVVVALAATTAVHGCGRWVASTAFEPIPDNAFPVKWDAHPDDKELYYCSCHNYTGSAWNDDAGFGPGWKCWYTTGSNRDFCHVGDFRVLVSDFPSSTGPRVVNSTTTRPVPKGTLPGYNVNDQFSCVQQVTIRSSPTTVPGSLAIDSNTGNYVCKSVTPNGLVGQ